MKSLLFRTATIMMLSAITVQSSGRVGWAQDIGLPSVEPGETGVIDLLRKGTGDWKAEDGRDIDNWRVHAGVLTNWKAGSHLVSRQKFRDFDLSLEFNLPRGGNSGVYLRGRYEVQLFDGQDIDLKNYTGAIWGLIPPESRMYKGPNVWNELQVRLVGRTVTVLVNRKPVIRSHHIPMPTRGAVDRNEARPGPILLQSLRGARFRNILIKEL